MSTKNHSQSEIKINRTPLIEVEGIFAKLECCNPCGSIKDRIASYILEESERKGLLKPGMTIIEATSGNTGIALAYHAREKGYAVKIVMPENMTDERKQLIADLGAELILCSKEGSFAEAAAIRDSIAQNPQYFNPDQFSNPLNVQCHYETTGQEILRQISEYQTGIDAFVAGVGTGGTLIGVSQAIREQNPSLHIVAVEPLESAVMSGGVPGAHKIAGIGDGFIPTIASDGNNGLHETIAEVIAISDRDAMNAAVYLERKHGYCVGVSSGANFLAAKQLAKRFGTVVTVFADGFSNYKSEGLQRRSEGICPYEQTRVNVLVNKNGCDCK